MASNILKEITSLWRVAAAEFIGTFVFTFVSLSLVLVNAINAEIGVLAIALGSGLAYMAMVFATVHISGGHLNPAITLALWFTKRVGALAATIYICAQILAGFVAALCAFFVFSEKSLDSSLGATVLGSGVSLQSAVGLEAILTAVLIFTYFSCMVDRRGPLSFGPLVLGVTMIVGLLIALPTTGASLNPARVIGAAVITGSYNELVVWLIGPLAGSLFGFVYEYVFLKKSSK